ncbi:30S ribosomal protein S11 [Tetrabaena socialis]|uniref:30S ribosomal protein S11 n=1 Tax=Tetrabaena socialis TaxID=47790 RepID=A0A2J8A7I0_9CHLO|nr:30S ribosomal protein S11 [Tetrabaena socialis]|eukprot:PNH08496.1 30S ribosomal protein S11 [Tetrabaena socialis]
MAQSIGLLHALRAAVCEGLAAAGSRQGACCWAAAASAQSLGRRWLSASPVPGPAAESPPSPSSSARALFRPDVRTPYSTAASAAASTASTGGGGDAASASGLEDGNGDASASGAEPAAFATSFRRVLSERRSQQLGSLEGIVHIQNTFNNIILTLTDREGFIKTYTSAGQVGFRGSRKSQPVAAERAAEELAKRALRLGYYAVQVRIKGPGNTKQYAVASLASAGLQITSLADVTPIPYNGCRPPKRRRV